MGMKSINVQEKKDLEIKDEESETKRKTDPCLQDLLQKDISKMKNPSSPAAISIKADGKEKRPAEVFRTDFITAMKVPDTISLQSGKKYTLVDTWKQEWEKGVQVPVNPDAFPAISVRKKELQTPTKRPSTFCLPKNRITFNNPEYAHTNEKTSTSNYDLDDLDVRWLSTVKTKNKRDHINEGVMEKAMTYFERKCFEKMAHAVATKKGLSIEYDETTICDVCLSPDTEECNEIVFCDACNMCAHQACYGVPEIPSGTWLCRPCSRGILSPPCTICPNRGGAMKRLKGSFEWIHVICAWWVPEVKIEDIDNVERISIDKIPASRKNLSCHLCREKMGACIQCSVKRCVTAYHVTCGVKNGLELKTVMMHEKDDVQHISYCKRHCIPQPPDPQKQRPGDNVENQRLQELQKLQETFYKLINVNKSAKELHLSREAAKKIFAYWVLKRKANENRPLVPLTTEQQEKLSGKQGSFLIQEQINVEIERFALLRQDLERLRNLCYLIIRRERVKKEVHRSSQEVFLKQNELLSDDKTMISDEEFKRISSDPRMKFTKFPFYSMDGPPYADHLGEEDKSKQNETSASVNADNDKNNREIVESKQSDPLENIGNNEKQITIERISESALESNIDKHNESLTKNEAVHENNDDSNEKRMIGIECNNTEVKNSNADSVLRTINKELVIQNSNSDSHISSTLDDQTSSSTQNDDRWSPSQTFVEKNVDDSTNSVMNSFAKSSNENSSRSRGSPKKRAKSKGNNCFVVINRVLRSSPRLNKYNGRHFDKKDSNNSRAKQRLIMDFLKPKGEKKKLDRAINNKETAEEPVGEYAGESACESLAEVNEVQNGRKLKDISEEDLAVKESIAVRPYKCVDDYSNEISQSSSDQDKSQVNVDYFNDCSCATKPEEGLSSTINNKFELESSEIGCQVPIVNGLDRYDTDIGNMKKNNELDTLESNLITENESLDSTKVSSQDLMNGDGIDRESEEGVSMISKSDISIDGESTIDNCDFKTTFVSYDKTLRSEFDRYISDVTMEASDDERMSPMKQIEVNEAEDEKQLEERPKIDTSRREFDILKRDEEKIIELENEKVENNMKKDTILSLVENGESTVSDCEEKPCVKEQLIYENTKYERFDVQCETDNDEISAVKRQDGWQAENGRTEDVCFNNQHKTNMRNAVVLLKDLSPDTGHNRKHTSQEASLFNLTYKQKRSYEALGAAYPPNVIDELLACPQRLTRRRTHSMMTGDEVPNILPKNKRKQSVDDSVLDCFSEPFLIDELTACPQRLTRRRAKSLGGHRLNNEIDILETSNNFKRKRNFNFERKKIKKRTRWSSMCETDRGEDGNSDQSDPLNELDACPQRLTRASVKSLGFLQNI